MADIGPLLEVAQAKIVELERFVAECDAELAKPDPVLSIEGRVVLGGDDARRVIEIIREVSGGVVPMIKAVIAAFVVDGKN